MTLVQMNVDIFNYWNPCQFRFTGVKMQSASDQGSECFAAFLLNGSISRKLKSYIDIYISLYFFIENLN